MRDRMRKRTLGVALLTGLAMSGGGAFTASNAGVTEKAGQAVGYGQAAVTGATVEKVTYNRTADGSKLNSVDFVISTDIAGKVAVLSLKAVASDVGTQYECDGEPAPGTPFVAYDSTTGLGGITITCSTSGVDVTSFNAVGLSVADA